VSRLLNKRSAKKGLAPGTPVLVSDEGPCQTSMFLFDYDAENVRETAIQKVEECLPFKELPTVTWLNITGLADATIVEEIGKQFGLHPLTMEDILSTGQRPKMEEFDSYIYIVLKMLRVDKEKDEIVSEQVSLILGPNFVISFQEKPGDVFDVIRERIRNAKGRIRRMQADYLAYSLLDSIIDNYFVFLDYLNDKIEPMDEELLEHPDPGMLGGIHALKSDLVFLRKCVWPVRELINGLMRGESKLIGESTRIYLKDLYDHIFAVIDSIETFRDLVSGMLDIYLSSVSNRMNEVMKVLTIIATIFIPLTFIAGIYGMNFEKMPELKWKGGYYLALGLMALVGVAMVAYFRRKKWL